MQATATIDFLQNSFSELETQTIQPSTKDAISRTVVPMAAVTRAHSLQDQDYVAKICHLFALREEAIPLGMSLVGIVSTRHPLCEYSQQTASSAPRQAVIEWLLDLKAWGVDAERLKASVKDLLSLERGWDGEDAEPISPTSAEYACAFIDALAERSIDFEPFPDPNGLVGLEAHKQDKVAYLSFSTDGLIAYVFKAGNAIHRGNKADTHTVKRVLNTIF